MCCSRYRLKRVFHPNKSVSPARGDNIGRVDASPEEQRLVSQLRGVTIGALPADSQLKAPSSRVFTVRLSSAGE